MNDVSMLSESSEDGCTAIINRLTRPLWSRDRVSLGDVVIPSDSKAVWKTKYAVTINVCPNKKMNNKIWKTYDHIRQTAQLQRLEAHMRKLNPSIQLVELQFEICPALNQIHFHALYDMPKEFVSTMENYWREKIADKKPTIKPWRYLDIQQVYNEKGWIRYINKDKLINLELN